MDQRRNPFRVVRLAWQKQKAQQVSERMTKPTILVVSPPRDRPMA